MSKGAKILWCLKNFVKLLKNNFVQGFVANTGLPLQGVILKGLKFQGDTWPQIVHNTRLNL